MTTKIQKNMKAMKKYIILAGMTLSTALSAQELSIKQHRQFNLDALRTLETYEECSALYGNAARMDFDLLFEDHKMYIFNDLNGLSAAPKLSVADYSELLNSKGRSTQVIIKNIRKGIPYYDDGWKMDVTFDKEITYANACEILFSSKNFFGADFHIDMTLLWDEDMRTCTICRLDGQRGSDIEMLPQEYSILTHTSERDFQVKADGDTLSFNAFGQAFLSAHPKIAYPDKDVRVKAVVENAECNTISLQYYPKRWRTKLYFGMAIGDFYQTEGVAKSSSSGYEFGMDLGYYLPSKGTVKFGIFAGAGLSQSKMDMSIDKLSYEYQASSSADIDGDSYTRHYTIQDMTQTLKTTDVVIPLYLDADIRCGNALSIYVDAGFKAYLNLSNKLSVNSGTYSTYGIFKDYGIEMHPEDNWNGNPIDGFVTDATVTSGKFDTDISYKGFSIDLLGRAGARYLVYQNLFVDLGVAYQMGLLSPFEASSVGQKGSTITTESNALMSYSVSQGETVRSIHGYYSDIKRQTLSVNLGVIYRF